MTGSSDASAFSSASTWFGPTGRPPSTKRATASSAFFWIAIESPIGSDAIQFVAAPELRSGSDIDRTDSKIRTSITGRPLRYGPAILRLRTGHRHVPDEDRSDVPGAPAIDVVPDCDDV